MSKKPTKGSYCGACHTYFQLRAAADGSYKGTCPKCGRTAYLAPGNDAGPQFVTTTTRKTSRKDTVNVWDACAGGRIIGVVSTGTPARLMESRRHNGVLWYKIETAELTGWVSGSFIRKL